MDFYGSHSIEKILSTIIYSIEKHNVHVVVIDTLQFLLSEQGDGFKKFELQDTLMARLREITIRYNVHVVVVIHPRKTDDGEDIGIHSIYGTSKSTQEADNIWLIQNRDGFKIFDIRKNRYDGELGRIPLGFNRNTKNFFQLTVD
jgi:twinkle protein